MTSANYSELDEQIGSSDKQKIGIDIECKIKKIIGSLKNISIC